MKSTTLFYEILLVINHVSTAYLINLLLKASDNCVRIFKNKLCAFFLLYNLLNQ